MPFEPTVLVAGSTPPDVDEVLDEHDLVRERDFVGALEVFSTTQVDCIVATHSDSFDGLALLERVREENRNLPFVLLVTDPTGTVARRAVEADVTALIPADAPDAAAGIEDVVTEHARCSDDREDGMPISDLPFSAERRLKERALDEAPVGITISDASSPEYPIIYLNDQFSEITGYDAETVIGANHRFLQGPSTAEEDVAELASAISDGRETSVVLRNYRANGQEFWNQVTISPIYDDDGDVDYYVGFQADVTEREAAKARAEQREKRIDQVLQRVQDLFTAVTDVVVSAERRDELEAGVVERIDEGSEYVDCWLGRYDPEADSVHVVQGADSVTDRTINLTASGEGVDAVRAAVESGEPQIPANSTGLPTAGTEPATIVPLVYRSTTYGVLVIYDGEFSDEREAQLLGSLGRVIGSAINSVLARRTRATDTVVELEFKMGAANALRGLATDASCSVHSTAVITDDRNGDVKLLLSVDENDVDALVAAGEHRDDVSGVHVLVDTDPSLVQVAFERFDLLTPVVAADGELRQVSADPGTVECRVVVPTESQATDLLSTVRDRYGDIALQARQEVVRPPRTTGDVWREFHDDLTERQLTALRKAYQAGYFESPRRTSGENIAASMGIVPSTFHQHLQTALSKLLEITFEEDTAL